MIRSIIPNRVASKVKYTQASPNDSLSDIYKSTKSFNIRLISIATIQRVLAKVNNNLETDL